MSSRIALLLMPLLAACQSGGEGDVSGDTPEKQPYGEIAPGEVLQVNGTEPFWGATVNGNTLTYTTPESISGEPIAVERFAGRGGLSFSGLLRGKPLDMTVTPGACSDGMSDRSYPFMVMLRLGSEKRSGCAWSDEHPFSGKEHP